MNKNVRAIALFVGGIGCMAGGYFLSAMAGKVFPFVPSPAGAVQGEQGSMSQSRIENLVREARKAREENRPGWGSSLLSAAAAFERAGLYREGRNILDEVIAKPGTPDDFIDACRLKAQYASWHGDDPAALAVYEKLWPFVDAHPETIEISALPIASATIGHVDLLVRFKRYEEALVVCERLLGPGRALFERVLDGGPVCSALLMRSHCCEMLGQRERAIEAMDDVLVTFEGQVVESHGLKLWIKRAHLRDGDRKIASPEYLQDMASLWNNQELAGHPDMFEVGSRLVDGYIRAGMPWEARVTAREVLARLDANRAAWTGTGPGAESTAREHEISLLSTLQTSHETIGLPEWSIEAMERSIPLQKHPNSAANLRQQIENLKIAMAQHPEQFQKVFEKARR